MRKEDTLKIAKILNWSIEDVKRATSELRRSNTIVNVDKFLMICSNHTDPQSRWNSVLDFLLHSLKGNTTDVICKLLNIDDSFRALAFFNIYDYIESSNTNEKELFLVINKQWDFITHLTYTSEHKSFIYWSTTSLFNGEQSVETLLDDPSPYPDKLSYKFLDTFIYSRVTKESIEAEKLPVDYTPILYKVISRVGFLAFNIEVIRKLVSSYSLHSVKKSNWDNLYKLYKLFDKSNLSKQKTTERKYWLWFILVEKYNQDYSDIKKSSIKVAELLTEDSKSVRARYYEMKRTFVKMDYQLNDLIIRFNLERDVENYYNQRWK